MILERYKGHMIEAHDCNNDKNWTGVLVDVDDMGALLYNLKANVTMYIPFFSNFIFGKNGKPEDREDED